MDATPANPVPETKPEEAASPERDRARLIARDSEDGAWGAEVPLPVISLVRDSLKQWLLENGYTSRTYRPSAEDVEVARRAEQKVSPPLAEAYFKSEVNFRKEPIVIDSGSRRVNQRPVLSIAVRPIEDGPELKLTVARLLASLGVHPMRAMRMNPEIIEETRPADFPTDVFRLKPIPPPGFGGALAKLTETVRALLSVEPDPAIKPVPVRPSSPRR